MRGAIRDGIVYLGKLVGIALVVWTVVLTPVALLAQKQNDRAGSEDSCAIAYERQAIRAWDRGNKCFEGTNGMPNNAARAFARFACHWEYVSDAEQAYADYLSCMSFSRLWTK